MEFFIPGLLLFLVAIILSFFIAPKVTPLIAAVLSIGLLTVGVYEHHKMFASEYRLSTWQDGIKIYAPAVMIFAILLFIIYSLFAFFSNGKVPIPSFSTMTPPSENTATHSFMNSVNSVVNSLKPKNVNRRNENRENRENRENTENIPRNKNKKNISRSILEVI